MTTYMLPEVPRVTIERNRREVRDHKTGKPWQIGFKMFNAAETLEIGYALLHVAEEIQQEDRKRLQYAKSLRWKDGGREDR